MADEPAYPDLTDTDLAFVVAQTAPDSANPARLAALVREDPEFRKAMIGDERVLEGVLNDEEVFLKVSPALYFEVLLRGSLKELETAAYTVERSGRSSIPVFDTSEVTELLMRDGIIEYLAHMLTSFTKPLFPILGVFSLKGQPKRDGSSIVRSARPVNRRSIR